MKTVALITFGCAKNLIDSEVMAGYLSRSGYAFARTPEEADIVILNTCGFIEPAKKEATSALRKAVDLKRKRKGRKIIAAGCYVERYRDSLGQKFPEIDIWLGVKEFDKIVQAVEGLSYQKGENCFLYSHTSPRFVSSPPGWAYIKISEGCSHQCSFCAIPLIKGPYQSRPVTSILEEAQELARRGVKEINLISQDTTYFGREMGLENGLPKLLRGLLQVQGIEWIRILYGYPDEISDELLEIMKERKICSYLDLPFQHSDSKIIKKMKRGMDGKRALHLIERIRRLLPDIALRTSLVVGFPPEGKKEFENLKNFVRQAKFTHLGVFTYSREDGTDAFFLGDPIREREKEKRKKEIMGIQTEISFENNSRYLGQIVDVLIEGTLRENPNFLVGRGRFQAPEVDGIVIIDFHGEISPIVNTIQKVEITGRDVYDLQGKIVR